jgi:hypothetical protein
MKFLNDIDQLIKTAVNEALDNERAVQVYQSSVIDKQKLRAKEKSKVEDVEEAEDEDDAGKKDKSSNEEPKKLKGDGSAISKEKLQKLKKDNSPDEDETSSETPGTSTSKKMHDPDAEQLKSPDFKSIAQNINLLRGGKSLKDPDVKQNLKAYIDKLGNEEKRDVLVYLNSLAQVMAGVKQGANAAAPSSVSAPKQTDSKVVSTPSKQKNKTGAIIVGA